METGLIYFFYQYCSLTYLAIRIFLYSTIYLLTSAVFLKHRINLRCISNLYANCCVNYIEVLMKQQKRDTYSYVNCVLK